MNPLRSIAGRALLPAFWALVCTLAWAVAPANAATQTFIYTAGEQSFVVPAGVTSVRVIAIGGHGGTGDNTGAAGGAAALVVSDLVVTPGQVLYVQVAGNGESGASGGAGAFNGGGDGGDDDDDGGGGGGATDVRSAPRSAGLSPDRRLIVAGGGGGGGADGDASNGGVGGAAGSNGADDANGAQVGGNAGTASTGGTGGFGSASGFNGQLALGGDGGSTGSGTGGPGGGGAAGYYGGGGGSGGISNGGGGGGGGSSLVPAGGSQGLAAANAQSRVEITYTPPSTPSTPVADTVAPAVRNFGLANSTIRAAGQGGSIARAPIGTRVSYRLSEAATARFTVQRAATGRRRGRRCVAPTRKNRKARRCTRYLRVRGSFSHAGKAGLNRFRFTGRLRGKKLRPGRYRLVLVATDAAGRKSLAKRARFRVVRR